MGEGDWCAKEKHNVTFLIDLNVDLPSNRLHTTTHTQTHTYRNRHTSIHTQRHKYTHVHTHTDTSIYIHRHKVHTRTHPQTHPQNIHFEKLVSQLVHRLRYARWCHTSLGDIVAEQSLRATVCHHACLLGLCFCRRIEWKCKAQIRLEAFGPGGSVDRVGADEEWGETICG